MDEAPNKVYLQKNTTTDCYGEWWPEGFLCWDSEEVEARGSNGTHFLHQIFSKKQLFQTKNDLCKHYIKMFEKFMDKEDEKC